MGELKDPYAQYLDRFLSLPPEEAAMTEAGWIIAHTHLGPQGGNTLA